MKTTTLPAKSEFLSSIDDLRRRAREHMNGAQTQSDKSATGAAVSVLNEALATEIVCNLRYRYHYYMASGMNADSVKQEFLEHAREEQEHADRLAERITQLGGRPNFNPADLLARSHAEYIEGSSLEEMIKEDLVAERIAIESYSEMIRYFATRDPTTRRLLEEILAKEEEHAEDLASILGRAAS